MSNIIKRLSELKSDDEVLKELYSWYAGELFEDLKVPLQRKSSRVVALLLDVSIENRTRISDPVVDLYPVVADFFHIVPASIETQVQTFFKFCIDEGDAAFLSEITHHKNLATDVSAKMFLSYARTYVLYERRPYAQALLTELGIAECRYLKSAIMLTLEEPYRLHHLTKGIYIPVGRKYGEFSYFVQEQIAATIQQCCATKNQALLSEVMGNLRPQKARSFLPLVCRYLYAKYNHPCSKRCLIELGIPVSQGFAYLSAAIDDSMLCDLSAFRYRVVCKSVAKYYRMEYAATENAIKAILKTCLKSSNDRLMELILQGRSRNLHPFVFLPFLAEYIRKEQESVRQSRMQAFMEIDYSHPVVNNHIPVGIQGGSR